MDTSFIIFLICVIVFTVVSFFVAIRLMFVFTKRLAKVSLGEMRPLNVAKLTALLMLLAILCLFNGCVTSCCSGFFPVAKDYTTEATVGITSFCGFPVWFKQAAPGIRAGWIPNRIYANWCVWTTVFMLACCGIYFVRTKSRFALPAGIVICMACAGMSTFWVLTATDSRLPVHAKMRAISYTNSLSQRKKKNRAKL